MTRPATAASDPASVLAALLAESPEATVAAIEALLTSDEAADVSQAARLKRDRRRSRNCTTVVMPSRSNGETMALVALEAACRSLLSKAPKDDGDA
jgi:hypothetical protein